MTVDKPLVLKRTSLYVSGASPVNMNQAVFYDEDCLVYDLEDSVPESEKDAARLLVYETVRNNRPANKYVIIRVNGIYSRHFKADIKAGVAAGPDALRVPKVESGSEARMVSDMISEAELACGRTPGSISLWCNIESYMGVLKAREIASADPRIEALAIGAEDLTASLRAARTKKGIEILYARNAVLMACREAGVDALDAVFSDINDMEGLREDAELAKTLGFDGKTVVHPRQIRTVNECFSPSKKEIRYALRVLDAIRAGEKQHKGAITLDGGMIDKPMERRAQMTLMLAKAAGITIGGLE